MPLGAGTCDPCCMLHTKPTNWSAEGIAVAPFLPVKVYKGTEGILSDSAIIGKVIGSIVGCSLPKVTDTVLVTGREPATSKFVTWKEKLKVLRVPSSWNLFGLTTFII